MRFRSCAAHELGLFAQVREQPDDYGEDDAEDNAGGQREVDRGVFAAPGEIAGKAAEGDAGFAEQQDHGAGGGKQQAETDEEASEVAHASRVQGTAVLRLAFGKIGQGLGGPR